MNHYFRSLLKHEAGVSTVEFALIAPVLVIMLVALLDYAVAAFHTMELKSAARSGAQYAMIDSSDSDLIEAAVTNSTNLNADNLTVTISEFCECSDASSVACDGSCASGDVRTYMQISASYDYSPFFLPSNMTLSGESIIRTD